MMTISAMVAEIERISDKLIQTRDSALTAALSDLAALQQRCEDSGIPLVAEDHAEMLRGLVGLGTGLGGEGSENDIFCDDHLAEDDVLADINPEWTFMEPDTNTNAAGGPEDKKAE